MVIIHHNMQVPSSNALWQIKRSKIYLKAKQMYLYRRQRQRSYRKNVLYRLNMLFYLYSSVFIQSYLWVKIVH
jgi:hypothetical protein